MLIYLSLFYSVDLSVAKENRTSEQTEQKTHSHRKQIGGSQTDGPMGWMKG